jgi:hypothetical protein
MVKTNRNEILASKWIVIFISLKVILYYWLCINGFPKFTSDAVGLQGPAAGFLLNNKLNAEIYKFKLPYANELISYPSGYILTCVLWFKMWGISIYSAISLDMALELSTSIILAQLIFKKTRNLHLSGLIIILSMSLLYPIGRPELLAIFLLSLMVILIDLYEVNSILHSIIIGIISGFAIITSPISSFCFLLATAVWFFIEKTRIKYILTICITAFFTLTLIWGMTINFDFIKGFIQLSQWGDKGYSTNFFKMIFENPLGNLMLVSSTLINILLLSVSKQNGKQRIIFISYIIISLTILSLFKRLEYDYRLLIIFNLTSIMICINKLDFTFKIAVVILLFTSSLFSISYNIIKPALVILTFYNSEKYEYNKNLFKTQVPETATVGGSGNLWTFLDDGRHFYSDRYIDTSFKPDYMVYRGVNDKDSLRYVIVDDWKSILTNEYILISNVYNVNSSQKENSFRWISTIFNTEDADFRFRIWKKKSY